MSCFFIAYSLNNSSIGEYFTKLSEELAFRGHRVIIITEQHRPNKKFSSENIKVLKFPSNRPTKFKDFLFLLTQIKKEKPDCTISNFSMVNLSILSSFLLRVPNRIAWYHTIIESSVVDHKKSKLKINILKLRKRVVYYLSTKIIPNSRAAAEDVALNFQVSKNKLDLALPYLISLSETEENNKQSGRIVSVGRLDFSKGQSDLIKALPQIIEKFPEVSVDFIGGGNELFNYESLAKTLGVYDHCRFLGNLPLREVKRKIAEAEICVITSHYEAFGLVAIESQSVGTPVIATNAGGLKDLIINDKTGYLIPVKSPEKIALKVINLLGNPNLRDLFSKAAKKHFEKNYSFNAITDHAYKLEKLISN